MGFLDLPEVARSAKELIGVLRRLKLLIAPQKVYVDSDGIPIAFDDLPLLDAIRRHKENLWRLRCLAMSTKSPAEQDIENYFAASDEREAARWSITRVAVFGESRGIDTSAILLSFAIDDPALIQPGIVLCQRIWAIATAEILRAGGQDPTTKDVRAVAVGRRQKLDRHALNKLARDHLQKDPSITADKLAKELGVAVGVVSGKHGLSAWKAHQARKRESDPAPPNAISMTNELQALIDDQAQDDHTHKIRTRSGRL